MHHSIISWDKTTTFKQNSSLFINSPSIVRYIYSSAFLTFRCIFRKTIYLWPQNIIHFRQSLLHCSQISFPGALLLGLQSSSSRWETDPGNTVDGVATQNAIHGILALLQSTCDTLSL